MWLTIPATEEPKADASIARLAIIPHGNAVCTVGFVQDVVPDGLPAIPPAKTTPFPIGGSPPPPGTKNLYEEFDLSVPTDFRSTPEDVVLTLERTCAATGTPRTIRVDQGSEFISRDLDLWAYANNVMLDFSRPGKPTDNAFIEAFNGRFRAQCLNTHWFLTLADAREKLEAWRRYYNEVRPYGAIGNKVPISMQTPGDPTSPSS